MKHFCHKLFYFDSIYCFLFSAVGDILAKTCKLNLMFIPEDVIKGGPLVYYKNYKNTSLCSTLAQHHQYDLSATTYKTALVCTGLFVQVSLLK